MVKTSAGLLLYRRVETGDRVELLIGHMGGPFFSRKDAGAWSIPKGEYTTDEEPLAAAVREFTEELGVPPPAGEVVDLGTAKTSGGKVVWIFARQGDLSLDVVVPGTFEMEWPRGSGRMASFPEIDRALWVAPEEARAKLVASQVVFVDRLLDVVAGAS
jgi:predicted NUDIX family NTP pyrophosphohydrolase